MQNNVIYLRVSKEELDENTQLPEIIKAFNLKESDCLVLQERISAYKEERQKFRSEFIKLRKLVESGQVKNLYVYSLERLERNTLRLFEFYFFCEANGCNVHGVLQPSLELEFEKNPMGTFAKYQQVLLYGLLGENESYMTSQRTKKSFEIDKYGNKIVSKTGVLLGGRFNTIKGSTVKLKSKELYSLKKYILSFNKSPHDVIIKQVGYKYGIKISSAYISKVRKGFEKSL